LKESSASFIALKFFRVERVLYHQARAHGVLREPQAFYENLLACFAAVADGAGVLEERVVAAGDYLSAHR
jgi:hypothetical protein